MAWHSVSASGHIFGGPMRIALRTFCAAATAAAALCRRTATGAGTNSAATRGVLDWLPMSSLWVVDAPSRDSALPAQAVSTLLCAMDGELAQHMLDFLNSLVEVDHITLVRYERRAGVPCLVQGHARQPAARALTGKCFGIYMAGYWRSDQTTALAQRLQEQQSCAVTALHQRAQDIPLDAWRQEIYERERLADRLSFVYSLACDESWAINLYRDTRVGAFRAAEVERLLGVAPLLRQVHRTLNPRPDGVREPEALAARLRRHVPALSARELAVCARIGCGIGTDGIAAELGIAPSSVCTLRKRAYAKLADAGLAGGRIALLRLAR